MKRSKDTKFFSPGVPCLCLFIAMLLSSGCRSSIFSGSDRSGTAPENLASVNWARELFANANEFRESKGVGVLLWSEELAQSAHLHAQAMAHERRLSHDGFRSRTEDLTGRGIVNRLTENVAYGLGHENPARTTLKGWNESSGHRRNLLDARASMTGVGFATTADGYFYVVQLYGR